MPHWRDESLTGTLRVSAVVTCSTTGATMSEQRKGRPTFPSNANRLVILLVILLLGRAPANVTHAQPGKESSDDVALA